MFINMNMGFGGVYEVTLEVFIEGNLASSQTMQAPRMMIEAQFISLLQQMRRDSRHIKIKMSRPEVFWDNFDKVEKTLINSIEVDNRGFD